MNGRIYDPVIGRFLSADPFVQAPYNLQSYNRYAYVLNNPLKYTDPSGYFFGKIGKKIGKWVGFAIATYFGGPIGAGIYKAGLNSYRAARNGAGAFGIFKAAAAGFAKGYVKAGGGGPSFGQNVKRGFKLGRRAHGIYKNRGNPVGLAFASLDAAGELFGSKTLNKGYEDLGDGTILIEGHRVPLLAGGGSAIRAERSWWNRLKEGLVRGAGLQPGDGFFGTNLSFGEIWTTGSYGATEGIMGWVDGFNPFGDPLAEAGYYNRNDPILNYSRTVGSIGFQAFTIALGGYYFQSLSRSKSAVELGIKPTRALSLHEQSYLATFGLGEAGLAGAFVNAWQIQSLYNMSKDMYEYFYTGHTDE